MLSTKGLFDMLEKVLFATSASVISLIHIMIIVYVVVVPFLPNTYIELPFLLLTHLALCGSMMVHWWLNNDTCCLTVAESWLRGIEMEDSFMHRLVSPVYTVDKSSMGLYTWVFTYILMGISLVRVYSFLKIKIAQNNTRKLQ
jgi:hypothetical protein